MPGSWLALLEDEAGRTYVAAVALAFVLLAVSRRLGPLFFLGALPATIAHELMHLGVGLLTHGQPSGLRLWPQRSMRGYVLGAVTCNNVRWYNGLFIGLAPLLLLPVALALLLWRAPQPLAAAEVAWVYLIACLAYASLPSWQDLRVALASSWLLITVLAGVALAASRG